MSLYKFKGIGVEVERQIWTECQDVSKPANFVIWYDNDWANMARVYMIVSKRVEVFGFNNSIVMNLYDPFWRIRNELK